MKSMASLVHLTTLAGARITVEFLMYLLNRNIMTPFSIPRTMYSFLNSSKILFKNAYILNVRLIVKT